MSLKDIDLFQTNEEYVTYEDDQDFKIERLSEIEDECEEEKPNKTEVIEITKFGDDDYKAKCGEIFISNSGKMYFACSFCEMNFKEAEHFKNHMFKQHLNLEEEEEQEYVDSEDPADIGLHSPNLSEGEDNDIVSKDVKDNYKIIDGEYTTVSVIDEVPIDVQPNITSPKKDYIEHFRNFLDDTLSGCTTKESENDNSSLKESAFTKSLKTESATSETEETTDSDFHCDICNKKFRTKRGIANHRVRHDGIASTKDVLVSDNPDSEDDESNTKTSVKTVKNSLKCPYCGKQFQNTAERVSHERTHTGEKPFKCQECGNNFRLNRQLEAHMRTHTGERPYPCPHCPAKFANRTNMTVHVRTHLGIKRFSCEVCNRRFVRNVEKRIHMRIHTGEKPYQCETCGASYNASCKLTEHMKRHTNTRPHKCEICNKYFYSKDLLKNHQTMHSDERPFECNQCEAKFPRKRALQCHMKIHSDVKEYVCNICGKAFAQNAGLYGHMKTHGLKPGTKTKDLEPGESFIM